MKEFPKITGRPVPPPKGKGRSVFKRPVKLAKCRNTAQLFPFSSRGDGNGGADIWKSVTGRVFRCLRSRQAVRRKSGGVAWFRGFFAGEKGLQCLQGVGLAGRITVGREFRDFRVGHQGGPLDDSGGAGG